MIHTIYHNHNHNNNIVNIIVIIIIINFLMCLYCLFSFFVIPQIFGPPTASVGVSLKNKINKIK